MPKGVFHLRRRITLEQLGIADLSPLFETNSSERMVEIDLRRLLEWKIPFLGAITVAELGRLMLIAFTAPMYPVSPDEMWDAMPIMLFRAGDSG
jgi:hypothetical protein